MEARTTFPHRIHLPVWTLAALGLLIVVAVSLPLLHSLGAPTPTTVSAGARIAYFEFETNADTLWLADPAQPTNRRKLLVAPHATDFGVIPSPAPDGRSFVYTVLPAGTAAPGPDSPAQLWLFRPGADAKPVQLASNLDLVVKPVWSPDGASVVYRRSVVLDTSVPGSFQLFSLDTATGRERLLASADDALFPVAFTPDGSRLLYTSLAADSTDLKSVDLASGAPTTLARLADGLTREWALSPDRTRLAYLAVRLDGGDMTARAWLLDLETATPQPLGDPNADAFSPTWGRDGSLTLGQLRRGQTSAGLLRIASGGPPAWAAPARGFDVPLAPDASGDQIVVRSFLGTSTSAPGPSALTLVGSDGSRRTIASGEVTFLGWLNP